MADDNFIARSEHEEFRRLEEENRRQNNRLKEIEDEIRQVLLPMSSSVEKLALNMENMLKEQVSQGKRLETLEKRDGEKWREVVKCTITALVGAIAGYFLHQLGL